MKKKKKKKNLQAYVHKSTILWIILSVTSYLVLVFLDFYSPIKVPGETLNWVFSTIAQTFAALLAFLGMVSIYKLQIIQNTIKDLSEEIRKEEREIGILDFKLDTKRPFFETAWKKAQLDYEQVVKKSIKSQTLVFFKYTLLLIFLSLILLVLSPIISSIHLVSLFSLTTILIMSLHSMMHAIKLIKGIL